MAERARRGGVAIAAVVAIVLVVLAGRSSFGTVSKNESGVVLRFGAVTRVVPSGMSVTLPWPFEKLIRVSTTEVRTMPLGFRLVEKARGLKPTDDD